MQRDDLIRYLDQYLRIAEIEDYGPQGLQVESKGEEIQRIALAVDVSVAGIQAATDWEADMLLVHHGVLWREVQRIAGPLGARVRALLAHDIHLYAAHLPLDAHPEVGNNAVLAAMLDVSILDWWGAPTGTPLGVLGTLATPTARHAFCRIVNEKLACDARMLAHGPDKVHTVAILSGFGADRIGEVQSLGADTYLTGETSHQAYWAASDYGLNVVYAGHYATETVGVRALGEHLAEQFELEVKFFDFPTGM